MSDRRIIGLGARLLLFIIPVIIASLMVSGFVTGMYANRGVERAMNRLLVYKAEDLVRHTNSQWELILDNGLQGDQAYLNSFQSSVRNYAVTMLRSEGEWIFAIDEDGLMVFSVGAFSNDEEALEAASDFRPESGSDILVSGEFGGAQRVGYGFNLPALGWDIYITDLRVTYFTDSKLLRLNAIVVVLVTVLIAALFIIYFVRRSMKPLRSVVADMRRIVEDHDFGNRVDPIQNDEVGELARNFNLTTDFLERATTKLKDTVEMEIESRQEIRRREQETLEVLGRVSEGDSDETAKHTSRVGAYASHLSMLLGDSADETDLMLGAAPLHDIGKIGIPDELLMKKSELTAAERKLMMTHVEIGWNILKDSSSPVLKAGADIALYHHERWDGSGYPQGLKGTAIPSRGRITGLADVFDALTTKRSYKEVWPLEKAAEWIMNQSGKDFDPDLVELFFSDMDAIRRIIDDYAEDENTGSSAPS